MQPSPISQSQATAPPSGGTRPALTSPDPALSAASLPDRLDLVSDPASGSAGLPRQERRQRPRTAAGGAPPPASDASSDGRPFIGVQFDCCSIYTRIYRNASATAYVGNCPRCARRLELKIGSGGSDSRFFTVN